ncbi:MULTISPECIES: sirohydrochlorin cobaltochelatase [unclassified Streptococcus]|uniref:sirohydrochlorin cobaltochelatase n=1 Tax=unclassified Streptococcus TaxID=2608887 RepID=UPI0010716FB4|nr:MULTISPECIES: sirohydrochlorin cobaltochelatase [unclassified Streptococcus]MBF0805574.1 sirohydrochlorin cobaltochelatase [Streptococcus sp. 19428wA2_WM07]TFU28942.1 sirohydrochlorin cobaltochelatase [Streptococcus sp. WM07]
MKSAIIAVSFGTSYPETREKTIGACEARIEEAFPEYNVFRAFTSQKVIQIVAKQEGIQIPNVQEILSELAHKGVEEVYLQPLHLIAGAEYEKMLGQARKFDSVFKKLGIGRPLLDSEEDFQTVAEILLHLYGQDSPKQRSLLMGHGSQHPQHKSYDHLTDYLPKEMVQIACVEGNEIDPLMALEEEYRAAGVKRILLAPLMLVAGDHASHDLAGDGEDSWASFFRNHGYEVDILLQGLGQIPEIQDLYISHVQDLLGGAV